MTRHTPLPSLRSVRSTLAALALTSMALLGAHVPELVQPRTIATPTYVEGMARADEIRRLERARLQSFEEPSAAIPVLVDLTRGAMGPDVRERAAELLLDSITRDPGCTLEGLETTLRYVYVSAQDEQLRQRALLFLLARQIEELPTGAQGAFLTAILPQVLSSARRHQLPPSVTLAQAVHESGWGRSRLAREHHNLFGVKAGATQKAVSMATHEHQDGELQHARSRFRAFGTAGESIEHHAALLARDRRYAQARAHWNDWRSFLAQLAPTYATDPAYADRIANLVERYDLDRWDSLIQAGSIHDNAG